MPAPTLGGVPPTARRRLVDHYGPAVDSWLDAVPGLLSEAASRWGLTLVNYHDAGCASSIAVARTPGGRSVLIKAWYERTRYTHEILALRTWHGRHVPKVVHQADDLAVAALELVGGQPGGAIRPPGELEAVALALADLHAVHGPDTPLPHLDEYLGTVVRTRIGRRLHDVGGDIPPGRIEGLRVLDSPVQSDTLLHADLYQENVPFDVNGRPVFVDPLPWSGIRSSTGRSGSSTTTSCGIRYRDCDWPARSVGSRRLNWLPGACVCAWTACCSIGRPVIRALRGWRM